MLHTRLDPHDGGGDVVVMVGELVVQSTACRHPMLARPEILGGTCTRGQLRRSSTEAPPQIPRPPFSYDIAALPSLHCPYLALYAVAQYNRTPETALCVL